ncbi:MAG: DUF4097 family beta strand repeat-containing protein [Thermoanaerobacteraceae bacterium]
MDEEKELILNMLKDGKITSEDASKLLEAIEENEEKYYYKKYNDEENDIDKKIKKLKDLPSRINEKVTQKLADVVDGISELEKIPVEIEKNIDAILNKKDNLKNGANFNKTLDFSLNSLFGIFGGRSIEKEFKLEKVIENSNIDVISKNGKIEVLTWDNNYAYIILKFIVSKEFEKEFEVFHEDNLIKIEINQNIKALSAKLYLPNKKYNNIYLSTTNSKIKVDKLDAEKIDLYTSNDKILLEDIKSNILEAYTKNGEILFKNVILNNLTSSTTNDKITAVNITFDNCELHTTNGKIMIDGFSTNSSNSMLKVKTTNDNISLKMADKDTEVFYELKTTNGKCHVNLYNLQYEIKDATYIKESTKDFGDNDKNLSIIAYTTNGNVYLEGGEFNAR